MYKPQELFHILNEIFNMDITEQDITHYKNRAYLVKRLYLEPLYSVMHSNDFKNVIQASIK